MIKDLKSLFQKENKTVTMKAVLTLFLTTVTLYGALAQNQRCQDIKTIVRTLQTDPRSLKGDLNFGLFGVDSYYECKQDYHGVQGEFIEAAAEFPIWATTFRLPGNLDKGRMDLLMSLDLDDWKTCMGSGYQIEEFGVNAAGEYITHILHASDASNTGDILRYKKPFLSIVIKPAGEKYYRMLEVVVPAKL